MKKDKLTIWTPIGTFPKDLLVEAIHNDYEGFRILLKGGDTSARMLRVHFESYLSYKVTDESWLWKVWDNTPKEMLGKIFYQVENSSYISSFHENTFEAYPDFKIKHYGIYTIGDCVDILAEAPPKVEWLN